MALQDRLKPDQQHVLVPVDVAAVKLDGLTDPQPGGGEKPDPGMDLAARSGETVVRPASSQIASMLAGE